VRGLAAGCSAWPLSDRARVAVAAEAPYRQSLGGLANDASHARTLADVGFARDVDACLTLDSVPVAVRFVDGALRLDVHRAHAVSGRT
jgi:phosphosulfolactate phosphohydrolase-like enzyme